MEKLMMDVYEPPMSDQRQARPAMVYIHGGAFVGGDKSMGDIVWFMKELVKRGFVCASINYRLTLGYYPAASE